MSIADAFNAVLSLHKRTVTLKRPAAVPGTDQSFTNMTIHPTNYSRVLSGLSSKTTIHGYEFILKRVDLVAATFPIPPKRNDIIVDADLGTLAIGDVDPMYDLGGAIIAWRVRTE